MVSLSSRDATHCKLHRMLMKRALLRMGVSKMALYKAVWEHAKAKSRLSPEFIEAGSAELKSSSPPPASSQHMQYYEQSRI